MDKRRARLVGTGTLYGTVDAGMAISGNGHFLKGVEER